MRNNILIKALMLRNLYFIIFFSLVISHVAYTQVYVGDNINYYCTGNTDCVLAPTDCYSWSVVGGTKSTQWLTGTRTTNAAIKWTQAGPGSYTVTSPGGAIACSVPVQVYDAALKPPTISFTIIKYCGHTTVYRQQNPPAGTVWYWEKNSTDQLTTLGSADSIDFTSSQPSLFLRAKVGSSWSSAVNVGAINVYTAPPSLPTVANDKSVFYGQSATLSVDPISFTPAIDLMYLWYDANGKLLQASGSTSYAKKFLTTETFYVATKAGCESSTRLPVTITVLPLPRVIVQGGGSADIRSGPIVLTTGAYDAYDWRDAQGVLRSSVATCPVTVAGKYTVKVSKKIYKGGIIQYTIFGTSPAFSVSTESTNNYVQSDVILQKGVTDPALVDGLSIDNKSQTIQYFDGLGRPNQVVTTQGSPNKKDIVQPINYDVFGREVKKYLPYATTNEVNGWYKTDPIGTEVGSYSTSPQAQFYQVASNVAIDSNPFSESRFEVSPLNRILKQGASGTSWQPDATNTYTSTDHTIKFSYESNLDSEVLLWNYTDPSADYPFGVVVPVKLGVTSYYPANTLHKTKTKDEQGNEVVEFKDKEGKVILKKIQAPNGTWAQTYYIFNDLGNLVYVSPPEATQNVLNKLASTTPTITWANKVGVAVGTGTSLNNLTKNVATAGYGYSAATSTEILFAGQDGWVEMTANEKTTSRMIGLAPTNVDNGANITYALELKNDGKIYVWEGGMQGSSVGVYDVGTKIKISREGNRVKYYVDGIVKQTSNTLSTTELLVDVAIADNGGTIKSVNISFGLNATLKAALDNYSFRYVYDTRQRMAQKQVPGADPVYMVYDFRDRLVFSQDGNQRAKKEWTFTKYDEYNRPVMTGIYTADWTLSQTDMQVGRVDDYYKNLASYNGEWFETYTGTGNIHGYSNKSYPVITDPDQCLTVSYYDNYNFKTLFNAAEFDFKPGELTEDVPNNVRAQETTFNSSVLGLITGSKTRMLTTASWLKAVSYYDNNYHVIQQIAENPKGHAVTTNVYDFVGRISRTKNTLYTGQPAQWTAITNAQIQGETVTATSSTTWAAGAVSTQILPAGADGWVEFTVATTTPIVSFGLSYQNTSNSYITTDFHWYINNTARPYEKNVVGAGSTVATIFPGDVLRIERINGKIYFKKNGMVHFISPTASTTSLMADLAFYNNGSKISKVRLSPTFSNFNATPNYFAERFLYDHAGRLKETWHQINGGTEYLLSRNFYNELGQLIDKKLHSTVAAATDAKQSIDYRYNIRGWLTSINNSTLINDGATNDDTGDYFGMNLLYDKPDANLSSTGLFNGNISGMKYSSNLGLSSTKETGYNFSYDAMNRLTAANSRMNKTNVWQTGYYHEKVTQYDLNGNIVKLQRNGDGGVLIDDLTYNYGTTTLSNELLSVSDAVTNTTDKAKGFVDGNTSALDYSYDANGNLIADKNKAITVPIVYNYLNLPTIIVRSYSNINYLYDATGYKRAQLTSFGTNQKLTEYVGPWVFENNELQFLQHEEGRIVLSGRQKMFDTSCDAPTGLIPTSANATLTATTINGEKYVQVTPTVGVVMTKLGVILNGNAITVAPGERFIFRAKGFSNGTSIANFYVQGSNNTDVLWTGAPLPNGAVNESWVESVFTIPTGVTQISIGILFSGSATATSANNFLVNEVELIKQTTISPEYQYNIKDHLGNVRVTFTTKVEQDVHTATLETNTQTTEQNTFKNYTRSNSDLFDHTDASTVYTYAQLLNGGYNAQVGLSKSIPVVPGDVITAEVYAKFYNPTSTSSNLNGFASSLLSAFGLTAPIAGETGTAAAALNSYGNMISSGSNGSGSAPKAFITILTFDKNFNLIDAAWDQIDANVQQIGTTTKAVHDLMTKQVVVKEAGYAFIYLSNESPTLVDVYFDDFKITHQKSQVIQADDYYPFGLTFNSYSRESSVENRYLYNQGSRGKKFNTERITDLDLNIDLTKYRAYDPAIGRWWQVDPRVDDLYGWTPYNYGFNNPILYSDPEGDFPPLIWGILAVAALVLDAEFAEAPSTDQSPAAKQRAQENREYLREKNETVKTIVNPQNILKKIAGQQVRDGIKRDLGGTSDTKKKVPNPGGKNGGEPHQKTIAKEEKRMQSEGKVTEREVKVDTPGGNKEKRYVDLVGTDPATGKKEMVQVGKENKNGTPVSRERKAIDDIKGATGENVKFVPYNK
jgi:RHS repeat-associated protein